MVAGEVCHDGRDDGRTGVGETHLPELPEAHHDDALGALDAHGLAEELLERGELSLFVGLSVRRTEGGDLGDLEAVGCGGPEPAEGLVGARGEPSEDPGRPRHARLRAADGGGDLGLLVALVHEVGVRAPLLPDPELLGEDGGEVGGLLDLFLRGDLVRKKFDRHLLAARAVDQRILGSVFFVQVEEKDLIGSGECIVHAPPLLLA